MRPSPHDIGVSNTQQTMNRHRHGGSPSGESARRPRFSHGAGFWVIAAAFLISMGFTVVTTPLWSIYQARDGFSTFMVTVAFATYAVGVLVSLFLAGHVSDWMGRRTILLPAILIEALAAVLFIFWNDLPGLIVARFVSGIGIGMITATATAHIFELHSRAHPGRGRARSDIVSTAANIGGFAVGVIVSSALVQFAPDPTATPFFVFLILLLLAALGVAFVPETVVAEAERRRYRPQRVSIPQSARTRYFAAAAIAFAGFAVLGLFTALAPSFVAGELHDTSHLVGGAVVFATFASAAVLQIGVRRFSSNTAVVTGLVLYVAGFVALVAGVEAVDLLLFVVGGVLAGGAAGILFSTAISAAGQAAARENRGEALAGIFLSGYAGLVVPVVGLGAATLAVSMSAALIGFAVLVVVIAAIGSVVFLRAAAPRES
jgi:MFS family permease